ncbi:hypothetical protein CROQUDRAFT_708973 [Cronartium quercuum f. sp. fusiforme G11]|uniref:Nucleic-acid-binding protein from mobile element jockey n=1 Tax=Cronartium quercuum f. sp. fusiforme G11 TaxID=708437 RepID=A0A9P6N4R6_9BASI|nr:hypothetical protein CROQUDRAFT_708973 [Cronartium quercuum f. sp. fusiforme G11]
MDPKAANYAIRNQVSYSDLKRTERSYQRILQCHKCQDFGHFLNACTNGTACTHCAGEHTFENCDRRHEPIMCINCLTDLVNKHFPGSDSWSLDELSEAQRRLINHSAYSSTCPIRRKHIHEASSKPEYFKERSAHV